MRYPNRVRKRWIALRDGLERVGGILSEFTPFFASRKRGLGLALAVLLAETASSLAQPWPLALAIDYVIGDREPPVALPGFLAREDVMLFGVALLVVLVFTATRGASAFRRYLLQRLGQETVFDLREALYAKVHALGLDYHGRRRTGDTITRVTGDVREVRTLLVDSVVEVASSLMVLAGMLAVMLWLDARLTLFALLTVPFLFAAVVRYRAALIERMRVVRAREGAIASVAQEAITGIRAVKIFGREEEELGRFREESEESLRASVDSALIEAKFGTVLGLVGGMGTALVVYFGARRVLAGEMSVGDLTVFVSYLGLFLSPLWALSRQANQIGKSLVSGERIVELLRAEPAVRDAPDARPAPRFSGRVAFEGVRFAYDREAGEVLRGMSFEVEPGSRVALVGASGAGKSTVASLIARLYDPQEGRVLVDGRDIRRFTIASLRAQISFVPQEPMLFRGTVAENIAYGRPGARREEIERAARLAGADGFIRRLPQGYDTLVGERGESLSGGQRQRISIARAMLRESPILILDEPQAGLDAESAAVVRESWRALSAGRTTFVISHELRLVREVDRILVIEDGRVAESGTHGELLALGGSYARLHALQEESGTPETAGRRQR
ncbi:protein-tyrosine-phosphatase [Rubrobacter xylanophilus]|uniref:Protein-tyrosine-phosphatase n=1 Tax=Rubrobacter xylanophilus TaxID=49319 RepID=A0A510HJ90_9ACTN|nr:protein-tyrosine-phosphatase [Rubrobacter xylanophilus]